MHYLSLERKINILQGRVEDLAEQVHQPSASANLVSAVLEEIAVALEEIQRQQRELTHCHETIASERQRFQELFDFAPDAYLVTDIDGRIVQANRAAIALLQDSARRIMGKFIISYIEPEGRQAFLKQLNRLLSYKQNILWETVLQPYRGNVLPIEVRAAIIDCDYADEIQLYWLLHDLTERQEAREAARH